MCCKRFETGEQILENIKPEFLILEVSSMVSLVCKACNAKYSWVRQQGQQCLRLLIEHFGSLPDPDAGIDGVYLLDQYTAQIDSALKQCLTTETEPSVRYHSVSIIVNYISSKLCADSVILLFYFFCFFFRIALLQILYVCFVCFDLSFCNVKCWGVVCEREGGCKIVYVRIVRPGNEKLTMVFV